MIKSLLLTVGVVVVVSSLVLLDVVHGFPTGAGSCPGGVAAVGGIHSTMPTIESGDLDDYGIELAINGNTLSSSVPFQVEIDQDHTWELYSGSDGFRGFLLRLDGGNGNIDTTASLGNLPGMGGMVQVADVCTTQGVGGATHRSKLLKSSVSGSLFVGQESRSMTLDVTVVVANANGVSEYYYSSYTLHAVGVTATVTKQPTPRPTKQPTAPTKRPTAPVTNPPIPAPTKRPTVPTKRPTAPTKRPTAPTKRPTAPTERPINNPAPVAAPVVGEDFFEPTYGPTFNPTFSDTTNPQVMEPTVWFDDDGSAVLAQGPTTEPVWPELTSVFPTCSENNTCSVCEGDCDTDLDCEGHLACFQRDQWDYTPVPGCAGYGLMGRDYCFDPWIYPSVLRSGPEDCTSERPCGKCEGDCDGDHECAGNLECFHRFNGSNETVPGCYGYGYPGRDYCFDRADMPPNQPQPAGPVVTTPMPSPEGTDEGTHDGTHEGTIEGTFEGTFEGTGGACTLDVFQCPDGDFVSRVPPHCDFAPCPETACPQDVYECPSGDFVGRVPPDCAFEPCPVVACPQDVYECPSGDFVGRVPPDCAFEPCPVVACPQDVYECPSGDFVGRVPPDCAFEACPVVACTSDVFQCPDGDSVGRVPPDCAFAPCPVVACPQDVYECPSGDIVSRVPPYCAFEECPPVAACPLDVYECPSGDIVGRVPPDCAFEPCPMVACPQDVYECPSGDTVSRVPPDCDFEECPPVAACPLDVYECPSGATVSRVPPHCSFEECPPNAVCAADVIQCPSGDYVGRVPPNCEFEPCPPLAVCAHDVYTCPNGGFVGRNPANKCDFFDCPIYENSGPATLPQLRETSCTQFSPCSECFGDCDYDFQCADDLECWNRRAGELSRVPGCNGRGLAGYDYCYKPDPQSLRPRVQPCSAEKPCLKCQGDCDADEDCQGGLRCMVRRSNIPQYVPGCSGDQHGNIDYCYDPADDTGGGQRERHLRRSSA
eukprot:Sro628_g178050.1 receptor-like protein kinase (990) ;mRNA; r:24176-27788